MCSLVEQYWLLATNNRGAVFLSCPDQYVGDIVKIEGDGYQFTGHEFLRKNVIDAPRDQSRLILVVPE
jgi:hypothetical protein